MVDGFQLLWCLSGSFNGFSHSLDSRLAPPFKSGPTYAAYFSGRSTPLAPSLLELEVVTFFPVHSTHLVPLTASLYQSFITVSLSFFLPSKQPQIFLSDHTCRHNEAGEGAPAVQALPQLAAQQWTGSVRFSLVLSPSGGQTRVANTSMQIRVIPPWRGGEEDLGKDYSLYVTRRISLADGGRGQNWRKLSYLAVPSTSEFILMKEDHTLGNLLSEALKREKDVLMAGYKSKFAQLPATSEFCPSSRPKIHSSPQAFRLRNAQAG
jgi:hypothetical protein